MCGIAGILAFSSSASVSELTRLNDAMSHRGPDRSGTWLSTDLKIGLAHRRLSIIDLTDEATQPMTDFEGSVHVTYNGKIYNHLELRAELQAAGHRFRTHHSDTEVLIHVYKQWGRQCRAN